MATEQHHKEMQEYKTRTNDHIKFLEKEVCTDKLNQFKLLQNKDLREKLSETELLHKELQLKFEKGNIDMVQSFRDLQNEKSNLEILLKKYEDERKQNRELYDYEMHLKMNELKSMNDKLKEDHRNELENLNAEYDKSLKDLKSIYESV